MSINTSIWEPLKVPTFRLIWMSVIVSNLGTMIQTVDAGWLMASISGSDLMVALVQASNTMPMMVLSLVSGALADSFDRRGIVLTAQSFMFAVAVTLTILTATGAMTPWLLLSLTFLIGCGVAFHMPAWQASLGDIVPRDQISKAVNLNSMGFNLTRSIGPALGGVVVAVVGTAAAFAINAFSYIPMILSSPQVETNTARHDSAKREPGPRNPCGFEIRCNVAEPANNHGAGLSLYALLNLGARTHAIDRA